jgi:uncharacterized membrane protein
MLRSTYGNAMPRACCSAWLIQLEVANGKGAVEAAVVPMSRAKNRRKPMSELIAIAYPDVNRAEQVLATLSRLQSAYLIDLEDAVYVTKDAEGRVQLHQPMNPTGTAAAGGAVMGGIFGFVLGLFVLMPLAGAAVGAGIGAGTGALAGHFADYGIDDNFVKQLEASLKPNTSAIMVLVSRVNPDKVLPEVSTYGGTLVRTSLSMENDTKLRTALAQGAAAQVASAPPPVTTTPGTEPTA